MNRGIDMRKSHWLTADLAGRIKEALQQHRKTQADLGKQAGLSSGYVSQALRGQCKINVDMVVGLLALIPQIRSEWLLFGYGDREYPASADSEGSMLYLDRDGQKSPLYSFGNRPDGSPKITSYATGNEFSLTWIGILHQALQAGIDEEARP